MHFQRYTTNNPNLLQKEIENAQHELEAAKAMSDISKSIEIASNLGEMLTIARRESEARELMLEYLPIARTYSSSEITGWILLNLATANQYLDHKSEVNSQFNEAWTIAKTENDRQLEHYVLHHWGRSLAEDGELARAKTCFETALEIRIALNEPRQESTRQALEALAKLMC